MKKFIRNIFALALIPAFVAGCEQEVDHAYSRFASTMEITASTTEVILDESTPDEIALTVKWTPAKDYGDDFIMSYEYEWNLYESKNAAKSEYEDMGFFIREYTHEQLQDIMISDFGYLTSSWGTMQFTVTAEYEGTRLVMPEQSRVEVKVKTYGPKQFAADKVWMAGTAAGESRIQIAPSENNSLLYVWNGALVAGKLNFPVVYGDEENVIIPVSGSDTEAGLDPMGAGVEEWSETSPSWLVPTSEDYRVTLNIESRTVSIVPLASIMEIDRLYMTGSALAEEVEVQKTLENDALYAWRGELSAGQIWFPVEFNGERNLTLVPSKDGHDILDGQADVFTSVASVAAAGRYWEIPADGTYRIVVNVDSKTVKIYSAATDLQPKVTPEWKNTTIPNAETGDTFTWVTTPIEALWMWGTFDSEANRNEPTDKYRMNASLADPNVFVWSGKMPVGNVKFLASKAWNNVYAFGASNTRDEVIKAELGQEYVMVAGQGNNRYSYYTIPADTNFIMVDITDDENPKVVFDKK